MTAPALPARFLLVPLLALAACSSPTSTGRYLVEAPSLAAALPDRLGRTEMAEVSLPDYAAGQEVAWQTADGAVRSTPKQIWADLPPRAVTLELARQISAASSATVIPEPWPLATPPDRKLDVRVEEMLAKADGTFRLAGAYYLSPDLGLGGADYVRRFDIRVPVVTTPKGKADDPALIAAAQAAAIARLARQIAAIE